MTAQRPKPHIHEGEPLPPDDHLLAPSRRATLEILYRRHSAKLFRMLVKLTTSRDEASDLVQEIFSKLAGSVHQKPLDRPDAYLRRIARNLLVDRRRQANFRPVEVHLDPDSYCAQVDPVHALETRDMLGRLEAAMAKLKPKTRQIFMAHRLDGLSYAEIAKLSGMSVKGVEKQMSKAIAQIDRMLDRS